jgi:hypothetical protein
MINCSPIRITNPTDDCATVMLFDSTLLATSSRATVTVRSKGVPFGESSWTCNAEKDHQRSMVIAAPTAIRNSGPKPWKKICLS